MDVLRRSLAPIVDPAWEQIDDDAREVLVQNLSARRFVDVRGPMGFDYSAVNLGRVDKQAGNFDGVSVGTRRVLPLVEVRTPFAVSMSELDNLARGAEDAEIDSVRKAAHRAAQFEEHAIYRGLEQAGIEGLISASEHEPMRLGDAAAMPENIAAAVMRLSDAGVEGPYCLVLGARGFRDAAGSTQGYPIRQQLGKLLGTTPVYSPGVEGGLLVSTRGGDYELTLGQDMSIGYDRTEADTVHLYMLETFTFRVRSGEAIIVLS